MSHPNWIWSQDHKQYYRQEFINGVWVTIWQNQPPAAATVTLRPRRDSGNQHELTAAPQLLPFVSGTHNAHQTGPYASSFQYTNIQEALPTISPSANHQWNYSLQQPQAVPPYAGGSNYVTVPLTLQVPELQQQRAVRGTYDGKNQHFEDLDNSFYARPSTFFMIGKLIAIIFTEEAGSTAVTDYNTSLSNLTTVKFNGHRVHTQVRRFIVVRNRKEFCYAVPIFTYGGRATLKPGVRPDEHAIAYSSVNEPEYLPGEASMSKQPICIVDTPGTPPLHKASRIYFGIHHPIQYNVKVKDLGHVHPSDLVRMRGYWAMSNQDPSSQGIEVTSATPRGEVQQNVTPASPAYTNHTSPAMRVQPLQRSQPTVPVDENQNEDEDDEEEDEESVPPQLHSSTAYMHHTSPVMNVQQHQRAQPTIPSEEFGEEDEESSEDGEEAGERYIVR